MATDLPLKIQGTALPPQVRWKPQALADFIWDKARIVTNGSYSLFAAGSTEPSSNVGPWFNGTSWFYWSNVTGDYQPITLAPESLGYTIGANPPDQNIYAFWIETNLAGSPLALKIYYSGAWVDVYAAQLASYQTIAAFNAAIAAYSTTAAMNAAIAAAIASIPSVSTYPAQAELTAGPQAITLGAAAAKCTLNLAPINPSPTPFSTVNSRYVAPEAGNYMAHAIVVFSNNTGTPAGMQIILRAYVNGADTGVFAFNGTPSPNGSSWTLNLSILLALAQTDYIEFFAEATDGVDTGLLNITDIDASFYRVSA